MEPEEVLEQEEVVETPAEPVTEPMNIATNGQWLRLEDIMVKEFEIGKTYHIKVKGNCEFMVSKDIPTFGMKTNEITFTKQPDMNLWIKTGV